VLQDGYDWNPAITLKKLRFFLGAQPVVLASYTVFSTCGRAQTRKRLNK
jgi:hypothetical protein